MQQISTTPFGRRPITSGLIAAQDVAKRTSALPPETPETHDKYSLMNDLREARRSFDLSDRDLSVLAALLSFHQSRDLSHDDDLIVYPSNRVLSERAHGMAESTLRRHIAALVRAGLILRRDSPNGKRYAARNRHGVVARAFGFDLSPLVCRAADISAQANKSRDAAFALRRLREDVVVLMRDAGKLIDYGHKTYPARGWAALCAQIDTLRKSLRRRVTTDVLNQMHRLLNEVLTSIQAKLETPKLSGSASQNERHYHNSDKDSFESEPCLENAQHSTSSATAKPIGPDKAQTLTPKEMPNLPLSLVLKACPDILPYAGDPIHHWHQLVATANLVRGMLGITPETWERAKNSMGAMTAAITCAAILQRVDQIHNPGGYLRSLAAKAETAAFSPGPMVMALLNPEHARTL